MGGDGGNGDAEQEARLGELISKVWGHSVKSINDVLSSDRYYGFKHFEAFADPSIEEILHSLELIGAIVNVVLNDPQIGPSQAITLLNCQQCHYWIKTAYTALKAKDEETYQLCIKSLENQRQH